MLFAWGGVALLLTILASFAARMAARWRGTPRMIDGHPVVTQALRRKKEPAGFRLGIACPPGYRLRLHDEGWMDRWLRGIGINAERSVGDPGFDEQVFIDSDDDRVLAALRESETLRHEILQWRAHYANTAILGWFAHRGRLWVNVLGPRVELDDATAAALTTTLRRFADGLVHHHPARGGDRFFWRAALILATTTGLGGFGVIAAMFVYATPEILLQPGRAFVLSLLLSVPAAAALALIAIAWLGASARAHRVLAEVLTVGLAGFIGIGWVALREANVELDREGVQWQHHGTAWSEEKVYRCGRRNNSTCYEYLLHLPQGIAGPPPNPRVIEISREQYHALADYGPVEVGIGGGRFGLRWIAGVRRVAVDTPDP